MKEKIFVINNVEVPLWNISDIFKRTPKPSYRNINIKRGKGKIKNY